MSAETIAVYFGCWNEAGHFLWMPGRRSLYDHEVKKLTIPTAADLDGSFLFLPRPEKTGTGCITYMPAIDRTILAWWGSPWDKRGAVNKDIVAVIRKRSGNRCEGSPRYPECRAANGDPHPATGSTVVLTTGHLDHVPEHCDPENLRHWCQRCHLTYDAKHHAETAYMTRRCKGTLEIFDD